MVELPFDEVTSRLPGDDMDDHARFMEATVSTACGVVRVASIAAHQPNIRFEGFSLYQSAQLSRYDDAS